MSARYSKERSVPDAALNHAIAARLREHLGQSGASLRKLAESAGVEYKKLDLIVKGEKVPCIGFIWKIANALGVSFGSLIAPTVYASITRKVDASVLTSSAGAFTSRALTFFGSRPLIEIYELKIAAGHTEKAQAHSPGTTENIVVVKGTIEIRPGREPAYRLDEGDTIHFVADVPHSYRNVGDQEAVLHLVLAYENFRGT